MTAQKRLSRTPRRTVAAVLGALLVAGATAAVVPVNAAVDGAIVGYIKKADLGKLVGEV